MMCLGGHYEVLRVFFNVFESSLEVIREGSLKGIWKGKVSMSCVLRDFWGK